MVSLANNQYPAKKFVWINNIFSQHLFAWAEQGDWQEMGSKIQRYQNRNQNEVLGCQMILLPHCLNRNHWILFVINCDDMTITCYDPYHTSQINYMKKIKISQLAAHLVGTCRGTSDIWPGDFTLQNPTHEVIV